LIPSPAQRPAQTYPGGIQDRADGRRVEVRTSDGKTLVRRVSQEDAETLVRRGLGSWIKKYIQLATGVRPQATRSGRPGERPDLEEMRIDDPDRYVAIWRESKSPHIGQGALGRGLVDVTVPFNAGRGSIQAHNKK
jgi:hypothetical protein